LAEADISDLATNFREKRPLPKQYNPSKHEHCLFSVRGQKPEGPTTALIVASTEADAEYYALSQLDFVALSEIYPVSDSVYVGSADTKE
jgi:hypothetical protein